MKRKTKFILKHYDTDQVHEKSFAKIDTVFEFKNKLDKKTGLEWTVVANTPFGSTPVFKDEKWKWQ